VELDDLQQTVVAFASERNWSQFHDAKNLCMALASEIGELNAILRWVPTGAVDESLGESSTRDAFAAEIADVTILLLLLYDRTDLDIPTVVLNKLAENAVKYPAETARGQAEPPDPSVRR